jgi:glucokinase
MAREFLASVDLPVHQACFAVAGPVVNGQAVLTNLPWVVDETALREALGLQAVRVLNDVQAMAQAIPSLGPAELLTLQQGDATPGGAIGLIAPGTGLGQAFLTWDGTRYLAHASEGSHTDFGPTSALQTDLLRFLQRRLGRVSYERVCAGRSIPDLYEFLRDSGLFPESAALGAQLAGEPDRTPVIVAAGLDQAQPDPLCRETLNLFASILGSQGGNLALAILATGGIYISGGMAQRILPVVPEALELFLTNFHNKGRLTPLLKRLPVHAILEPVALLGASLYGFEHLPVD